MGGVVNIDTLFAAGAPWPDRVAPCDHHFIDRLWRGAAASLGFAVVRSAQVYASSDGATTLWIGTRETLDDDDSLAQLVLHELCHALVAGPSNVGRADWGMDNRADHPEDHEAERAAVRLQAAFASRYGLAAVLAPTTDVRSYYDRVVQAPLVGDDDPAAPRARAALRWARARGWSRVLTRSLRATQRLLAHLDGTQRRHALGVELGAPRESCGGCGWQRATASGARCRVHGERRVEGSWRACSSWEPPLDCQSCGACCRQAYHSVTVSRRDPVVRRHPGLIVVHPRYLEVRRAAQRCAALVGDGSASARYHCEIYDDRPRTCRHFERGGPHCLDARRRVGLGGSRPTYGSALPPQGRPGEGEPADQKAKTTNGGDGAQPPHAG